jgi:DNA-binding transcriptional regulator LsrR (DeoR family)
MARDGRNDKSEDRLEFLSRVASMYYEHGMTQHRISKELGYSRSAISRFLTEAREVGIVEIRVHHPRERNKGLEANFKKKFGVREVRILVRRSLTYAQMLTRLGSLGARLLDKALQDELTLGVSWGTAVYEVVNAMRPRHRPNMKVIQLVGALGSANPEVDGPELAQWMARLYQGRYQTLPTPLVVDTAETRDALMRDSHVRDVLEQASNVEIALVGVGTSDPRKSGLVRSGHVTNAEGGAIARAGAVGEVCAIHYDIYGEVMDIPIAHRTIGIQADTLRQIPFTIGVSGGPMKAPAILGALRAGFIDALVTDDETAKLVLRLAAESE